MPTPAAQAPWLVKAHSYFAPGFAGRLGLGFYGALLLAYSIVAGLLVQQTGSLDAYAVKSDFLSALVGSRVLLENGPQQVYNRAAQTAAQAATLHDVGYGTAQLLPFIHTPFELGIVAPLRALGLSYGATFIGWMLVSLLAVAASLRVLHWAWPLPGRLSRVATLAVLSFFPVYLTLVMGQTSLVLLFSWAAGSAALRRGRDGWAGVALAVGLVKPHMLVLLLLVLLLMRRWRALGSFAVASILAVGLAMPILGWDWPWRYLQYTLSVGGYPPDPILDPVIMQNWRGLLTRWLGDSPTTSGLALLLSGVTWAVIGAIWLRVGWRGWQPGTPEWDRRWAITLLASLLALPYLITHDLSLLVVPGWLLLVQAAARHSWALGGWLWLGSMVTLETIYGLTPGGIPLAPTILWMIATLGGLLWIELRSPRTSRGAPLAWLRDRQPSPR
jgi:hypothetical protein